jgi:hypothetical protein
MIIIFVIKLLTSRTQVEKNTVRVTDDFIEVQFWKGQKQLPVQITRIPYWYLKEVHRVTDEEWKKDMKMSNLFRKIGLWPFRGPSGRFHNGAFRKDLCTIQFSDRMDIHNYIEVQGSLGMFLTLFVSILFSSFDRHVEDQLASGDRIYVSISSKDYERFSSIIDEKKNISDRYDPSTGMSDKYMKEQQEPLDDSWYTDLFASKDQ